MNSRLNIREYVDGDEKDIIPLFEKVFGKPMGKTESVQHWRWEILGNPVKPIAIMLAWDGNRLVSQEAGSLLRFSVNGAEYLGLLIFDSMTDPEYKGQGIFTETARSLYSCLTEHGYEFVYGFPNANVIQARIKKLDWNIISPMPIHVRPIDVGPFVKNKTHNSPLGNLVSKISKPLLNFPLNFKSILNSDIEIRLLKKFDKWADELWAKCRDQHKIWVIRDFTYLSWRYNMRPESQYNLFTAWLNNEIVGYVITTSQMRNEGKVCFILDIVADINVNGVVETLLTNAINSSVKNNDAMISAILMPSSVYRTTFYKFFFIPVPQRFFPQEIHFGGRQLNNKLSSGIFQNPASWHISWGDTDLL